MPEATIQVQFVNPPQAGKKMGSVKAADGKYYGVDPGMLGLFQVGGVYNVFYEERLFQGKIYQTVKRVTPNQTQAPVNSQAPGQVLQQVQRARTNEADAERMWVCALLGHFIAAGKLDIAVTDLAEAGRICLDAHHAIFDPNSELPQPGNNRNKQQMAPAYGQGGGQDDMNDAIPF